MNEIIDNTNLAGFCETNLAKFEANWVKKGLPRGQFFTSDKTENHTNKGKGKEKYRKRREKGDGCTPNFYIGYVGDGFWKKKTAWWKRFIWQ